MRETKKTRDREGDIEKDKERGQDIGERETWGCMSVSKKDAEK